MIYYAEDDNSIRELVVYSLAKLGYETKGFANADDFFAAVEKNLPELVLLDIMLPGISGNEILAKLKKDTKTANIPVIMLTAKSNEYDKVASLEDGADDYITKPFGMMELAARIKALLRRTNPNSNNTRFQAGKVVLDNLSHTVTVDNEPVDLTFKEFELLEALLRNKGAVLTRTALMESIWGYDYEGENRTLDVHVRTLRRKLGEGAEIIETVRNVGYRIRGGI